MAVEEERFRKIVEKKIEKIKKDESMNQASKNAFLKYLEVKKMERISHHRISRILDLFFHILKTFPYDLSKLTQEQANEIWNWIGTQKWKEWTKYTYSRIFKILLNG